MNKDEVIIGEKPYEYVVDLATIIYANNNKIQKLTEKDESYLSMGFQIIQLWVTHFSEADTPKNMLTTRLHDFLRSLEIPKKINEKISYTHSVELYLEDREDKAHFAAAPIVCAFLCNREKKIEEELKKYVLLEFSNTKLDYITELKGSLKNILYNALALMFDSDKIKNVLSIDTEALQIIGDLKSKKKKIAFVHNMPGHVELKDTEDKNIKGLLEIIDTKDLYISGKQKLLTTNPDFYKDMPLCKNALMIATCGSNTHSFKNKKMFEKILFYDYTNPKKLRNELNLE